MTEEIKPKEEIISFAEFMESVPPSTLVTVSGASVKKGGPAGFGYYLTKPELQIHCPHDTCNGVRFHRCSDSHEFSLRHGDFEFIYMNYVCSNCRVSKKTFSLAINPNTEDGNDNCYKFGELPIYGPPTPSRLIKLIGPDREHFLSGRRCENQGLGIGAFVYYRRVVENQKNRILDEIIKVSKKLGVGQDRIDALESAKSETQFSKAVESVKHAIPQVLMINGHNPLTLLHTALSDGLHDRTDEHCLELASSIRVVLGELSERLSQALKDEAEINNALSRLLSIRK